MKKALSIAKKELGTYFRSPIAYIALIGTIFLFNVFFFMIIDQNREASLRDIFKLMEFIFVFLVPILTMRTFAEEKRSGTMEFLLTSPVRPMSIVLGKYLGSLFFLSIIIGLTLVYYGIIEYYGQPDRGAVLAGYIGIFLEASFFISAGLLVSNWTKNQIIAAIGSYFLLFSLYFSRGFIKYTSGLTQDIIRNVSIWSHTEMFFSGLVYLADLVYFLSATIFFLLLTRISIGRRL